MSDTVVWTKIPITGLPEMRCQVHTTKDGRSLDADGDPIDMSKRTYVCDRDGRWMLGNVFLCQEHAAEVAHLMEDDIGEIEQAWREECL